MRDPLSRAPPWVHGVPFQSIPRDHSFARCGVANPVLQRTSNRSEWKRTETGEGGMSAPPCICSPLAEVRCELRRIVTLSDNMEGHTVFI